MGSSIAAAEAGRDITPKPAPQPTPDNKVFRDDARSDDLGEVSEFEKRKALAGDAKFHRLGWRRLSVVLLVTAIALGTLSLPASFATLGMVAGVICSIGVGFIAIYTGYLVGQVKLRHPHVGSYGAAGGLMFGKIGEEIIGDMLILLLVFLTAGHTLTGTIAFGTITENGNGLCSLVFGVVSAIILFLLAIPPSFAEVAILGYIDFASIITAVGMTIIATGIQNNQSAEPVNWSAWPKPGTTFTEGVVAVLNIVFAYSFALNQFSFMDEMHTPREYMKSIWTVGSINIVVYTLTGSLIYAFVGMDVKSPALLSGGPTISKIVFGLALPVIFISGSINTTVAARLIHGRIYKNSVTRYVNTPKGWITWLLLLVVIIIVGFIIAEAIPFFSDLVAITCSLLNSGFTLHFPALMWFMLLREGPWTKPKNLILGAINGGILLMGLFVVVAGTYASIEGIINEYKTGSVRGAFTCAPLG